MALLSSKSFNTANEQTRKQKGPLVRVEISPGRFVKMHREDAVAAGHLKAQPAAENKMLPAAENKMRTAADDKATRPLPPLPDDDLTTIAGVGPATARALKANGISTFEALRAAGQLDFVSPSAMQAIEDWRQSSDPD